MFKHLEVQQFRLFKEKTWSFSERLFGLVGKNGSGKTSFIEAWHVLLTGRSFLSTHPDVYIQEAQQRCLIRATKSDEKYQKVVIGFEKHLNGEKSIFMDKSYFASHRKVALRHPFMMIDNRVFDLLYTGAESRRRFWDRIMFHVEHDSLSVYQKYGKALQHRNALLKAAKKQGSGIPNEADEAWLHLIAEEGERLAILRERVWIKIEPLLRQTFENLGLRFGEPNIRWVSGFQGGSLLKLLQKNRTTDLMLGFTTQGPHRADWQLMDQTNASPLKERASRGQQKMVLIALVLAFIKLMEEQGQTPFLLLDDIFVELDVYHQSQLAGYLQKIKTQAFITMHEPITQLPIDCQFL